jgi:hypothetical protein
MAENWKRKYRPMTVNQLAKKLAKMIDEGHGKRYVSVDKKTFTHNLESDGVTILNAHDCRLCYINVADDDGGTAVNADGRERYTKTAILFGDNDDKSL